MSFGFEFAAPSDTDQDQVNEHSDETMVVRREISEPSERIVISVSGHFDIDHAAEVWDLLRQSVQTYRCVLVDLSGVRHMDSAGLASLAEAHRLARQRRNAFALIGVNQQVLKMLKLSGLHRVLRLYPNVAQAVSRLTSVAPQPDPLPCCFASGLARTNKAISSPSPLTYARVQSQFVA